MAIQLSRRSFVLGTAATAACAALPSVPAMAREHIPMLKDEGYFNGIIDENQKLIKELWGTVRIKYGNRSIEAQYRDPFTNELVPEECRKIGHILRNWGWNGEVCPTGMSVELIDMLAVGSKYIGIQNGQTNPYWINVTSGYRSQAHQNHLRNNTSLPAAQRSRHTEGRAVDFTFQGHGSAATKNAAATLLSLFGAYGFTYQSTRLGFCHLEDQHPTLKSVRQANLGKSMEYQELIDGQNIEMLKYDVGAEGDSVSDL